jgi:5-enolpyruvylshikimate-3-phosphate synthase
VTLAKNRLIITGILTKKAVVDTEAGEGEKANESATMATPPAPADMVIDSRGDHRIAMAFGILGTTLGGITISEGECVAKTFPQFWEVLKSLGGKLEINAK